METVIFNYNSDSSAIAQAIPLLKNGGVGIFPTDTVYGIGCDALNIQALTNLYNIKKRDLNKPICVLVSNINMLNKFVKNINKIEKNLIDNFWPGALTIIFDKSDTVPDLLTSGLSTIGIRMPNNKACLELINDLGAPLATSSANISKSAPYNNMSDFLYNFKNKVNFILNGNYIENPLPSTIVRVEKNEIKILREGSITKSQLKKCFGGNINVRKCCC